MSELERQQLRFLRKELGILPDHEPNTMASRHEKIAA
jgi:hypothetical protein